MRKSRFTEQQGLKILREADNSPVAEVAKGRSHNETQAGTLNPRAGQQEKRSPDHGGSFVSPFVTGGAMVPPGSRPRAHAQPLGAQPALGAETRLLDSRQSRSRYQIQPMLSL